MHSIPKEQYRARPWRIHDLTTDFRLEDVWEQKLPTPGGPDDFRSLLTALRDLDLHNGGSSPVTRLLFALRWKLGALLGLDRADHGSGADARVASLRDRLPEDLRDTPVDDVEPDDSPFTPLYVLDDEYASELANRTMHGVAHLTWVPDGGGYHVQLAVLVKPNGALGRAYMAFIRPIRHLVVYPALGRSVVRAWQDRQPAAASAA